MLTAAKHGRSMHVLRVTGGPQRRERGILLESLGDLGDALGYVEAPAVLIDAAEPVPIQAAHESEAIGVSAAIDSFQIRQACDW